MSACLSIISRDMLDTGNYVGDGGCLLMGPHTHGRQYWKWQYLDKTKAAYRVIDRVSTNLVRFISRAGGDDSGQRPVIQRLDVFILNFYLGIIKLMESTTVAVRPQVRWLTYHMPHLQYSVHIASQGETCGLGRCWWRAHQVHQRHTTSFLLFVTEFWWMQSILCRPPCCRQDSFPVEPGRDCLPS